MVGSATQIINLTTDLQRFTWTFTVNQSLTQTAGLGIRFNNLPAGVTLSAARPQLEQLPFETSYHDSTRSGEVLSLPSNLFNTSQGTIEAWVKPSRNYNAASSNYIQMITDVAGTGLNGLLLAIDTNGKFYVQAGNGTAVLKATSTTTAQKNIWYHVAGVWSSSGLTLYVNSVPEATTAGTPNIVISQTPTVGRQSTSAIRHLDGIIDELRILKSIGPISK